MSYETELFKQLDEEQMKLNKSVVSGDIVKHANEIAKLKSQINNTVFKNMKDLF